FFIRVPLVTKVYSIIIVDVACNTFMTRRDIKYYVYIIVSYEFHEGHNDSVITRLIHCAKIQHVQIRQTRGDTAVESEGLLAMVADNVQQSQPRGDLLTGSNNEKGTTTEESVNETNKSTGGTVNEEDCAKNHGWKGFSLKRQLSRVDLKIKSTFTPTLVTSQNGGQDRGKCASTRFPIEYVGEKSAAAVRPVNLTLAETSCETKPPPRLMKIVRLKQAKREGRLLSVPNLKFAKNDPAMICDLRCEEANTGSESFTCNLIRRFSKCLKLE
ncbi:unnamed protein product, partial [Heterotrigona itama]